MKKVILLFILTIILISCINISYSVSNVEQGNAILEILFGKNVIFDGHSKISEEIKLRNNMVVIGITVFFVSYWIWLLYKYEQEEEINYYGSDDIETLSKYNPLIAGCLVNGREVLSRDLISTILNLSKKGIVKLEISRTNNEKRPYKYEISRIKEKEHEMDAVEKYVHLWIFDFVFDENEKIDLQKRLESIPKEKDSYKRFNKLNQIAKKELSKIGANKLTAPLWLRAYNFLLLAISIYICANHIMVSGLDIVVYEYSIIIAIFVAIGIILIIPIIMLLGYFILQALLLSKMSIEKIISKVNNSITGKKLISEIISITLIFTLIIVLTLCFAPDKYLVLDELLIGIAILIVRTDNLMLKNENEALKDYYRLKRIKYKIENYSYLKEKNIEHIELWEEYLVYAISFGSAEKVSKQAKNVTDDTEKLEQLSSYNLLYYTCKAYLEVFWDMRFKTKKQKQDWQEKEEAELEEEYRKIFGSKL